MWISRKEFDELKNAVEDLREALNDTNKQAHGNRLFKQNRRVPVVGRYKNDGGNDSDYFPIVDRFIEFARILGYEWVEETIDGGFKKIKKGKK